MTRRSVTVATLNDTTATTETRETEVSRGLFGFQGKENENGGAGRVKKRRKDMKG